MLPLRRYRKGPEKRIMMERKRRGCMWIQGSF